MNYLDVCRPKVAWALLLAFVAVPLTALAEDADPDAFDGPWKYTFQQPSEGWQKVDFDDQAWAEGYGGFGTRGTPGSRIGTEWNTSDIWLRRTIELEAIPEKAALLIHHDDETEVFLNGIEVAKFTKWKNKYDVVPLSKEGREALKVGSNVLAVHTHQDAGGQYIDVHVVDADNVPKLPPARIPLRPYDSPLITQWGEQVTEDNVWQEYPRPQMTRENWQNLNGLWNYAITSENQNDIPAKWDGQILVPFALESKLSGVERNLRPTEALWYQSSIEINPSEGKRTLLNFEAVDYACRVFVNGEEAGSHIGGNVPFSIDITKNAKQGLNDIVVRVEDNTGDAQLRGKQTLDPHGIWYTQVSGIWQTVWLEQVPETYIADLKISTDPKTGSIQITPEVVGDGAAQFALTATVFEEGEPIADMTSEAKDIVLEIADAKLWSPSNPNLYDVRVAVLDEEGNILDSVGTYAGIRSVGTVRDDAGHLRFTLNGEVIFHWGPLDQGWWPDGLLTPPSDEAMKFDIEYLKAAGFNMIRKHIKVEPRRYYYYCDQMGMMVWQDQVSGGQGPAWTRMRPNPSDAEWSDEDHAQFMQEFEEMVDTLENHPCIVVWVPFNEAWGQHRTVETGKWILQRDPSRLVNIASGGNYWDVGHIADHHSYPHPSFPLQQERLDSKVKVVGEFGGHGWPVEDHLWKKTQANWGYGGLPKSEKEYVARYQESIDILHDLIGKGIAGAVYTQTTDVESEINGLMTYDRKVIKIPAKTLQEIHAPLTK
ncbi:glycoside hydrolase family 2 [Bremerella cremea]|uniref:Glycoside hydrolase family 2 n=1 Tax=Bremerella cremea TaxID=1031537 RepID=A0A368KUE5_9BACT|nr:sugar-binding domain-containing protein [Bremerella cremea]RCS53999.1 glycoside hydrolase family 2 [Bremerella cremea]